MVFVLDINEDQFVTEVIEKEFSDIPINGLDNGDILLIGWGSTNCPFEDYNLILELIPR